MAGRTPLLPAVAANGAAGTLFAWSVLLPALSRDLSVPADDLGVVFSTALVVFAAAMLLGGRAVDVHGPRRAAVVAGLASGCGLGLAAVAQGLPVLLAGVGLLFGFGSGLTYLSTVSWATTGTGGGRPLDIGFVVAAYAAGPVAAAPLAAVGAEQWGLRPTLVVAGVVVGGTILLAARGLPGPTHGRRGPVQAGGAAATGDGAALVSLWVFFFCAVVPGLLAFAYAAPIATERGVAPQAAGLVVALMAVGNLVGRLLPAALATRFDLVPMLWGSLAALVASLVLLSWSPDGAVVIPALAVLALQYGMVSALLPAATRLVSNGDRFAAAYGRVFSSWGLAGVVGPFAAAALHEGSDGYVGGFRVSLVVAALALAALLVYQRRLGVGVAHRP